MLNEWSHLKFIIFLHACKILSSGFDGFEGTCLFLFEEDETDIFNSIWSGPLASNYYGSDIEDWKITLSKAQSVPFYPFREGNVRACQVHYWFGDTLVSSAGIFCRGVQYCTDTGIYTWIVEPCISVEECNLPAPTRIGRFLSNQAIFV